MVEYKITESAQWQIPKSWTGCNMYVYGAPGTKFNIIEGNDHLAQPEKKVNSNPKRSAMLSRDSKRDFGVVGGKLVERFDGDPDEEEDGIG
jgi:hypothetical protein